MKDSIRREKPLKPDSHPPIFHLLTLNIFIYKFMQSYFNVLFKLSIILPLLAKAVMVLQTRNVSLPVATGS